MMEFDTAATTWVNGFAGRWPWLDAAAIGIAQFGHYVVVGSIVLSWWMREPRARARYLAVCCGLSAALGLVLNQAILLFVDRVRPYDAGVTHLLVAPSADPSFPSDHATVAFAVAFTFLRQRDRWTLLYLAAALLIGLARVYIGTHYLTDVIGGAGTAGLAALAVAAVYRAELKLHSRLAALL